jgi:hypothetical protein
MNRNEFIAFGNRKSKDATDPVRSGLSPGGWQCQNPGPRFYEVLKATAFRIFRRIRRVFARKDGERKSYS